MPWRPLLTPLLLMCRLAKAAPVTAALADLGPPPDIPPVDAATLSSLQSPALGDVHSPRAATLPIGLPPLPTVNSSDASKAETASASNDDAQPLFPLTQIGGGAMLGGDGGGLPPWWILDGVKPEGRSVDKGSWSAVSFSPEQQDEFGVDAEGTVVNQTRFDQGIADLEDGGQDAVLAPSPSPPEQRPVDSTSEAVGRDAGASTSSPPSTNATSPSPDSSPEDTDGEEHGCCFSITLLEAVDAEEKQAEDDDIGSLGLEWTDHVKNLRAAPPQRVYDKEVNVTDNRLRMNPIPTGPQLRSEGSDVEKNVDVAEAEAEVNVTDNRLRMNAIPTAPQLRGYPQDRRLSDRKRTPGRADEQKAVFTPCCLRTQATPEAKCGSLAPRASAKNGSSVSGWRKLRCPQSIATAEKWLREDDRWPTLSKPKTPSPSPLMIPGSDKWLTCAEEHMTRCSDDGGCCCREGRAYDGITCAEVQSGSSPWEGPGAETINSDKVDAEKSRDLGCCYRIGFGSHEAPCCLKTEQRSEVDCGEDNLVGGARGWRKSCPSSATEAAAWISAAKSAGLSKSLPAEGHADAVGVQPADGSPSVAPGVRSDTVVASLPVGPTGPLSARDWRTSLQYNTLISTIGIVVVMGVVFGCCWKDGPSGRRADEGDRLVTDEVGAAYDEME